METDGLWMCIVFQNFSGLFFTLPLHTHIVCLAIFYDFTQYHFAGT